MKKAILFTVAAMLLSAGFVSAQSLDSYSGEVVPVSQISGDFQAPELIEAPRPARIEVNNREITGYVTIEMLVNEQGQVERARVLYRSSLLAVQRAYEAVARWQFDPATLNGEPVKAYVAYNVPFGPELDTFAENDYTTKVLRDRDDALEFARADGVYSSEK